MDRCAVLVDAGYLLGGAYTLLTGERSDRSRLRPDYASLIEAMRARAEGETGLPVLRVYWYDAAFQRQPTAEHRFLRGLRDVKVRLGNLVPRDEGTLQQKGVDAELHADLITLARHRAVADVVVVTGDEDLCVAVERAQEYGVRVHLWAVPTPLAGANQSPELVATADRRQVLEAEWVRDHFAAQGEQPNAVRVVPDDPAGTACGTGPTGAGAAARNDLGSTGTGDTAGRDTAPTDTVPTDTAAGHANVGSASPRRVAGPNRFGVGAAEGEPDARDADGADGPFDVRSGAQGFAAGGTGQPHGDVDPFEVGREYGTRWCRRGTPTQCAEIEVDRPRIPASVDRELLRYAEGRGVDTWSDEQAKHAVRGGFWRGFDFVRDVGEVGTDVG